ncbi:hypothetical protein DVK44_11565 [Streptomyces paludis]|uniref:Uncharacterized protein n=1 Tax=Streptomyces paludis TaxID=2282738 RepID=A0A345HNG2_9ACTN|nr:hypothetical protein DVK44_11565 [Streptomyces paludis]
MGALCGVLLVGCSSGSDSGQDSGAGAGNETGIASVASPDAKDGKDGKDGKASSGGTGTQQKKGTMIGIDLDTAEVAAIEDAWRACLISNGAKTYRKGGQEIPDQLSREPASAYKACEAKEPYVDPVLDPDANPRYAEQTKTWMACMNRNGIEVSRSGDSEFFNYGKIDPKLEAEPDGISKVTSKCYTESYKW